MVNSIKFIYKKKLGMKRKRTIVSLLLTAILIISPSSVFAYESTMANMNTASDLESNLLIFNIGHRFDGDVTKDTLDTFFGTTNAAEVGMFTRYKATDHIEVDAGYIGKRRAYYFGLAYSIDVTQGLKTELRLQGETKKENSLVKRENHIYATLENNLKLLLNTT